MTKVQRRLRQLSARIRDRIASSLQLALMEPTGRSRKTKSVHPEPCPSLQHTRHFKLLSMIFMALAMKVGSDTSAARRKLCPKIVNGTGPRNGANLVAMGGAPTPNSSLIQTTSLTTKVLATATPAIAVFVAILPRYLINAIGQVAKAHCFLTTLPRAIILTTYIRPLASIRITETSAQMHTYPQLMATSEARSLIGLNVVSVVPRGRATTSATGRTIRLIMAFMATPRLLVSRNLVRRVRQRVSESPLHRCLFYDA